MKKNIIFCLVLFLFASSCGKEEEMNRSGALANFKLELSGRDAALSNIYSFGVYTSARNAGEYMGKNGFVVFNSGVDDNAMPLLKGYDLTCPHENSIAKIVPNKDQKAVCEACKSVYSLLDGRCESGPSAKRLWQYRVSVVDASRNIYRIHN